ncbi:MAG: FixG Ig-like domain-containing protein [Salinarimonas sp.]
MATLTVTTYILAGHAREQVCTWMRPWPRLQGAIWDPEALTVNYRDYRGEIRASVKKAQQVREAGGAPGDYIDFDSWRNIERGRLGEKPRRALVLSGLMIGSIAMRADDQLFVSRDANPIAVRLSDGRWRNAYNVRVTNLTLDERAVVLGVSGFPGMEVALADGAAVIDEPILLAPGQRREVRMLISGETARRHEIAITATAPVSRSDAVLLRFAYALPARHAAGARCGALRNIGAVIGGYLLKTLPPAPGVPRRAAWRGYRARPRSESAPRWRSR